MPDTKLPCDVAEKVNAICEKHGDNPGELINILHEAQHLMGYLPEEMQRMIARRLNIPVSKVYGVVTFYAFFTMTAKGRYPISVCMGTACYVRGSEKLLRPAMSVARKSSLTSSSACWASMSGRPHLTESFPLTAFAV